MPGLSESSLWFQSVQKDQFKKEGNEISWVSWFCRPTAQQAYRTLFQNAPGLTYPKATTSCGDHVSLMSDTVFSFKMNNLAATSPSIRIDMYHRHGGLPRYTANRAQIARWQRKAGSTYNNYVEPPSLLSTSTCSATDLTKHQNNSHHTVLCPPAGACTAAANHQRTGYMERQSTAPSLGKEKEEESPQENWIEDYGPGCQRAWVRICL